MMKKSSGRWQVQRDMHVRLEPHHNIMVKEISAKIWRDEKRVGEPEDNTAVRHAIVVAHEVMFPKK